jgi:hypothetical protein
VAEAVLFIEQNYREQGHQRALGYLMEELGKERFDIIHEIAPLLTKSGELEGPLQTISRHLVGKPLEESLRLAETLPTEMKVIMMEKLVGSFVETGQVDQAKEVLARMPYSERRSRAIEEILKPLARTDPEAAVSWALALPRAEDVRGAGRQFASAISSNTNLEALQSALGKIDDVRFRAAILKQVGKLAGEQGSVASAIQALGISGTERERLVAGSIVSAPSTELAALSEEILNMKDAATQSQAASAYLTRLLTIDEARAAQWAQNTPPPLREPALSRLVFDWYHTDSKAASDWVNALPEGRNRDIALAALSRRRDTPPNVRNHAVSYLVSKWHRTDATAAFNWVKSLPQGGEGDLARSALARILKFPDRNAAAEVAAQISDVPRRSGIQAELGIREDIRLQSPLVQ